MTSNLSATAEDLGWEEAINDLGRVSIRAAIRARYHRLLALADHKQREHAERVRSYWRWRIRRHLDLN